MTDIRQHLFAFLLGIAMILQSTHEMTIDEMIAGASSKPNSFDLIFDLEGRTFIRELDMLLVKDQLDALEKEDEKDDPNSTDLSREKRKAVRSNSYRWTNKIIPYQIANGVFSSQARSLIMQAIKQWEDNTCIKFRPFRGSDNNRVYFDNGQGCYSYVGMIGGSQKIGLAPGCRHVGVIVHEIGHAVGFHHEQNRPDRDNHVYIMRDNIPANLYYNFKKYPYSAVSTYDVPYDYGSVMHYGGTAFSKNGQYTIRTIDPRDQKKIGNRRGLSFFDIKLANAMYKCSETCNPPPKCKGHGFVGKDCTCWCPGNPIKRCTGTETTTKRPDTTPTSRPETTPKTVCKNQNKHCKAWAQAGYCGRNSYVKTYCKESCKMCSGTGTGEGACKDLRQYCETWKQRGYCKGRFAKYMSENCAKTCKACIPLTDPSIASHLGYQVVALVTSLTAIFSGRVLSLV